MLGAPEWTNRAYPANLGRRVVPYTGTRMLS